MTALTSIFSSSWGMRLGWMLVHSLWELGLIALLYSLVTMRIPRSASSARYIVGFLTLLCMIASLPATFACLDSARLPSQMARSNSTRVATAQTADKLLVTGHLADSALRDNSTARTGANAVEQNSRVIKPNYSGSRRASLIPLLPWLTALWFAGVMLFSLRLLIGLAGVERLRRVGLTHIESEIAATGMAIATRLGIRRAVKFATSTLVHVPTVIGYFRPLVLLPAVALTGLSIREMKYLLAHELAHIRRHDYLHNLVQGVVETFLFYHPAMWWVSSCVRRERENCCDDLVVATLQNRTEYARTLFALEQRRTAWTPSLSASDGRLLHRIRRLIGTPTGTSLGRQWGKGLAGFVVLLLLFSVPLAAVVLSLGSQSHALANDESKNEANVATHKESKAESAPRPAVNIITGRVPSPAPMADHPPDAPPPAVRIVVGPNKKLTFDGKETTRDSLEELLQKVPDRGATVLEVAISTDEVSVREMNDAIAEASHYGRELGFKYASYIGVHPLGSKGSSPQTHRLAFTPQHGMANKTSWTDLVKSHLPDEKEYDRLIAQVPLEGEFPVMRQGDKKPLFKVKLMAGSVESVNITLTAADGKSYNRVLHRNKPLSWKLNGNTYQILFPEVSVALDQPAESPFATIIVTCRADDSRGNANSSEETKKPIAPSDAHNDTNAPDESSDDSKHDGGSDMLRNIRASAALILAEMAEKGGYGLADGQAIRRVAPPFSELRMTYYRVGNPGQWQSIPTGPSSMTFLWINSRLQNWGMSFGPHHEGTDLRHVIETALGLKAQQLTGPEELLTKPIPGDWVIRQGQPTEVVAKQLEKILQTELSWPVKLEFRKVDRDVYVARGDYKLTPLPGRAAEEKTHYTDSTQSSDPVEIFGEELVPDSGSGGGTGDFAEFLRWLGEWIDSPIVDESGKHPRREISWRLNGHRTITDETQQKDHNAEVVLRNITRQTNLKFTKEKRPVRVLFIEQSEQKSVP